MKKEPKCDPKIKVEREKKKTKTEMSTRDRERDLELLIPVATVSENGASKSSSVPVAALSNHHSGREVRFSLLILNSLFSPL